MPGQIHPFRKVKFIVTEEIEFGELMLTFSDLVIIARYFVYNHTSVCDFGGCIMHFMLAFFDLVTIAKYFVFNHTSTHDFGGCITPERGCVSYVKEHLKFKMSCIVPSGCGPHYYIVSWDGDSLFGSNEVCMATKHSPEILEEYSIDGHLDIEFHVSHWKIRRGKRHGKLATAAKPLKHQCLQSYEDGYQQHALPMSYLDETNGLFQWRHFGFDQFAIPVPDDRVPLLLSAKDDVESGAQRMLVPFLIYHGDNGRVQYHANDERYLFYPKGSPDPTSELLKTYAEVRLSRFPVMRLSDSQEGRQSLRGRVHTTLNFAILKDVALPFTGKYQYDNETNYDCVNSACIKRDREVGTLLSVKATVRSVFTDIIDRVGIMFESTVEFITEHLAKVVVDTSEDVVVDLREYFVQNTGYDFMSIAWLVFITVYVCYKLTDSFVFGAGLFVLLTITLFDNADPIGFDGTPRANAGDLLNE